jgi:HNH endonuclease
VACDASIVRAVISGPSEPLDLGRRTPLISSAQRRAVILRDRICRFPGCDRPPAWCDVHHIRHWPDGGETSMCNLILLCRRHHRMCHAREGFRLAVEDGRPVFRRPDGSLLEDVSERAPPLAV